MRRSFLSASLVSFAVGIAFLHAAPALAGGDDPADLPPDAAGPPVVVEPPPAEREWSTQEYIDEELDDAGRGLKLWWRYGNRWGHHNWRRWRGWW